MSGPRLNTIDRFLRDTGRGEAPPWLREQVHQGDPAPAVSPAARRGGAPGAEALHPAVPHAEARHLPPREVIDRVFSPLASRYLRSSASTV